MLPATDLQLAQSTHRAGARPVVLVARMHYEMQCSYPGPGSLLFRFPTAMRLPAQLASGSVLVNGRPAVASRPAAGTVSVALPRRPQIMCDLIGPGTVTVTFTRAAKLGNPATAGTFTVRAQHAADVASGSVTVG